MDQMVLDQRVGVPVNEWVNNQGQPVPSDDPQATRVPPRFFGKVIEVSGDGLSGYVCMEGAEPGDGQDRVFFHCAELDDAPE